MSKKIFIFLSIAVFLAIVIIAGGYYFYKNPIDNNQQNNQASEVNKTDNEKCEGDQCITVTNDIVDGVFQKIEGGFLYFQPKDDSSIQLVKMTDNIVFREITLSDSFESIGEKNISLTDFVNGDQVSATISYEIVNPDERTVVGLSRVVVEESTGGVASSNSSKVVDGVFQKIEGELLYVKLNDSDEIKSIKITEDATFSELTLSASFEKVGEKNISLTDFKNSDSISVFVTFDSLGEEITTKLMRVIVLD